MQPISSGDSDSGQNDQFLVSDLSKPATAQIEKRGRFDHLTRGDVLRRLIDLHVADNQDWRFPRR